MFSEQLIAYRGIRTCFLKNVQEREEIPLIWEPVNQDIKGLSECLTKLKRTGFVGGLGLILFDK